MKTDIWIGCVQLPFAGASGSVLERTEAAVAEAAREGCVVVCLQELFHTPYFCQELNAAHFDLAEPLDGELLRETCRWATKHKIVLVVPFFEKRDEGLYHNAAVVWGPDGQLLGHYRKAHIPEDPGFQEKYYFAVGDTGYPVIETPFARIAVLICWDQWFPEAARIATLQGAEVLFYPTAIGVLRSEAGDENRWKNGWRIMHQSHAIANGLYVAAVNRTGLEGDLDFWGGSFVSDPFGEVISADPGRAPGLVKACLRPALIRDTRRTWPFLRDRRIDNYQGILTRGPETRS